MSKKKIFDFCLGNPPYMDERETTKDMPVYDIFMDATYQIAEKVELITPAKFLFNSGATSKKWNEKMLNDTHFKVLSYEADSSKVFANTSIAGGVAISYRDSEKDFGAIEVFSVYPELNSIRNKIVSHEDFESLSRVMYPYSAYTLSSGFWEDFPALKEQTEYIARNRATLSKEEKEGKLSNLRIITTNIFDLIPNVFFDSIPSDGEKYIGITGRLNGKRCNKYILKRYIDVAENIDKYKVVLSIGDGASGYIGNPVPARIIGTPSILGPGYGYTQTFQSIGSCKTKKEAESIMKYVCTKFARTALGILKVTQHYPQEKWQFVPIQDFTPSSDIDWSKSIHEIDEQLYKKYGLDKHEIDFIEKNVKEMN